MKKLLLIAALALLVLISGCTSVDTNTKKDASIVIEEAVDKFANVDRYSGVFDIKYALGSQEIDMKTKVYQLGTKKRIILDMETPQQLRGKGVLDRVNIDTYTDSESRTTCFPGNYIISSFDQTGNKLPSETADGIRGKTVCSRARATDKIIVDPSAFLSQLRSQISNGFIEAQYIGLGNVAGRPCDLLKIVPRSILDAGSGPEICLDTETGLALESKLTLYIEPGTSSNNPTVTTKASSFSLSVNPQDVEIPGNVVYSEDFSGALSQILPNA